MWRWRRGINCPFAGCYNQTLFSGLSAHHMAHSGWVCSQRTAWSSCPPATFPSLPLLSPPLVGSRRDNKKHWWNKRDIWGLDDANEGIWDDVTNVTCGGVNIFGNTHCKMPLSLTRPQGHFKHSQLGNICFLNITVVSVQLLGWKMSLILFITVH